MAIRLIANYSKRLGLPGFSSHQYSVSVETELVSTDDIPAASARLYELLQSDVDARVQQTGFVPPLDYGMDAPANGTHATNGNGGHTTNGTHATPENPPPGPPATPLDGRWKCSDKQRDLILKLVDEHRLDKHASEALAVERFGHGVRLLDKMEASGLIDELLDTHGGGSSRSRQTAATKTNGSAYRGRTGGRAAA